MVRHAMPVMAHLIRTHKMKKKINFDFGVSTLELLNVPRLSTSEYAAIRFSTIKLFKIDTHIAISKKVLWDLNIRPQNGIHT